MRPSALIFALRSGRASPEGRLAATMPGSASRRKQKGKSFRGSQNFRPRDALLVAGCREHRRRHSGLGKPSPIPLGPCSQASLAMKGSGTLKTTFLLHGYTNTELQ
jgi:hypothetical protein